MVTARIAAIAAACSRQPPLLLQRGVLRCLLCMLCMPVQLPSNAGPDKAHDILGEGAGFVTKHVLHLQQHKTPAAAATSSNNSSSHRPQHADACTATKTCKTLCASNQRPCGKREDERICDLKSLCAPPRQLPMQTTDSVLAPTPYVAGSGMQRLFSAPDPALH